MGKVLARISFSGCIILMSDACEVRISDKNISEFLEKLKPNGLVLVYQRYLIPKELACRSAS